MTIDNANTVFSISDATTLAFNTGMLTATLTTVSKENPDSSLTTTDLAKQSAVNNLYTVFYAFIYDLYSKFSIVLKVYRHLQEVIRPTGKVLAPQLDSKRSDTSNKITRKKSSKQPSLVAPPLSLKSRRPILCLEPKILVLDLDETLIHSTSRGTSHEADYMIEIRIDNHACLYYVFKRPHVDYFLSKVCEWYKVVVFTASVAEYADPVIDWLEATVMARYNLKKKIFAGRYFRESCIYRNGAFIKDLTKIEADLSKIALVDNSPITYSYNQDNAIPIQSWMNDNSKDEALLELLPFLDALRFVHNLRNVLSLRIGGSMRKSSPPSPS
ncbi:Nuclear envelope morphology protein 1 [Basidiobolus ranarum]|uniref:Nuclear envelope morphology protein 1 n=1 Tax=Basidiobolus ranarum TaxID=34480 RepID=A0ABR2WS62_9FUNG